MDNPGVTFASGHTTAIFTEGNTFRYTAIWGRLSPPTGTIPIRYFDVDAYRATDGAVAPFERRTVGLPYGNGLTYVFSIQEILPHMNMRHVRNPLNYIGDARLSNVDSNIASTWEQMISGTRSVWFSNLSAEGYTIDVFFESIETEADNVNIFVRHRVVDSSLVDQGPLLDELGQPVEDDRYVYSQGAIFTATVRRWQQTWYLKECIIMVK